MSFLFAFFLLKLKISLMYVFASISSLFGQILQMILLFFFWTNVYQADELTLQYVMWSRVVYGFIGGNSVWELSEVLKNGDVSVKLTKPMGYFRYTFTEYLATQMTNLIFICIPLSIVAHVISPIVIDLFQMILCIGSILLSVTICFSFDYVISLLCIYTHNTWGISSLRDGVVQILSGAIVPISLFPIHIRHIVYYFPFVYMVDVPLNIMLKNAGYSSLFQQLFYCVIMIVAAVISEKLFMKKLQIQGG